MKCSDSGTQREQRQGRDGQHGEKEQADTGEGSTVVHRLSVFLQPRFRFWCHGQLVGYEADDPLGLRG